MVLAFAAAACYLFVLMLQERAAIGDYEKAKVLVARADIPERTSLREDMIEAIDVPRKFMQQDAIEYRSPVDMKQAVGKVTRVRVPKGNQLTDSILIPASPDSGLSVRVPPGYRGAMLSIEPEMRALIKPGDRVDVLVTFEALMNDGHKEKVTATILQNILVIAVGNNLGQGMTAQSGKSAQTLEDKASSAMGDRAAISLALNPTEAQYLALAVQTGNPAVVLRGQGDVEMHPMDMASFRKLFK